MHDLNTVEQTFLATWVKTAALRTTVPSRYTNVEGSIRPNETQADNISTKVLHDILAWGTAALRIFRSRNWERYLDTLTTKATLIELGVSAPKEQPLIEYYEAAAMVIIADSPDYFSEGILHLRYQARLHVEDISLVLDIPVEMVTLIARKNNAAIKRVLELSANGDPQPERRSARTYFPPRSEFDGEQAANFHALSLSLLAGSNIDQKLWHQTSEEAVLLLLHFWDSYKTLRSLHNDLTEQFCRAILSGILQGWEASRLELAEEEILRRSDNFAHPYADIVFLRRFCRLTAVDCGEVLSLTSIQAEQAYKQAVEWLKEELS
jgi:hypothetical protein